jgi:phosphatidylserine/phosphatidylglycerophosphate/cardiolipin synthase-like enzyme
LLHNDHLSKRYEVEDSIIQMVNEATREIKVMQPYHYPMVKFDRAVIAAAKRGITPVVVTSGQRDQPVFKNIFNYMLFQRLIRKGIDVHETKERLLHSKVYLTDGRHINLGSMNNDRWSWNINNEVNLAIEDWREYEWVNEYFEMMKGRGRPVTKNYTISASRAASIAFWQNFLYLSEILMSQRGQP